MNMTRQERRAQERAAQRTATYNFTEQQLKDMIVNDLEKAADTARKEAFSYASKVMTACFASVIHHKHGFGIKRVQSVVNELQTMFESILHDNMDAEDVLEWCKEFGLDIRE